MMKGPPLGRPFIKILIFYEIAYEAIKLFELDTFDDRAEYIADCWAEQGKNNNYNNRNQNKNQRVLN